MNTATIIFLNDSPQFAFLNSLPDDQRVKDKLEVLAKQHYDQNTYAYRDGYESYRRECYWHTHTVEAELP
jgi:hypothetical protein